MNKKNLIGIGALTLALAGSLAFLGSNKAEQVKAEGPYSITNAEYDVAFLEQYCADDTNIISTEHYSYTGDKPLGINTIGGNQYGYAGPNNSYLKQTKFETNLMGGVNEDLVWRFSGMNTKWKSGPNRLYIQLENNSSNWNICKAESFPEATCPDEFAIGELIKAQGFAKGACLITTTAIPNVHDLSFFWRSQYTQKVFIVYQIQGQEWKILSGTGSPNGNYTGTRGWDALGYTTFNSGTWTEKELYGATAKIGIAITEAPSESGNLPVSAVLVNADKAAVRYLNTLSYQEHVCSDNGVDKSFDLNKGQSENVHNQDLFQLATERATAESLANYEVAGSKTTATSALDLYNHLVTNVSGLGSVKGAAQHYNLISNNKNTLVPAVIITCVVSASAMTILILIKKRKHN